ncbi:asparagine synthase (glutamine-hydrolyzing) [Caminibacter mediatlanticus]|uniref:asparagine synthase (glutamine-hydrolyzing) n=1 Tax=Caminibacter mediatlanticus TB-2 TaxID=391592 RepID=A0AAI9AF38_9BACT|nr:asparagine synthase (glutamine-hydrolyzing) [Caminibacter mediatlanticus]EDM22991.1 probable asparagine synthase, glutamine-hydrolyzing [Caminibacter mediatlanticus TB-2]
MCGIVGFINKEKRFDVLNNMLLIQNYRGPDDYGLYFDNGVHLGHNRLSILDLSDAGHQPFISEDENYVIVYNGEVYNFKQIRKELEKLGERFKSNSDTEVILKSYIHWGIEKSIEKFRGMFAFAIYDKLNKKIILVRDRAGVKPLYYYIDGNEFVFASELKSICQYPFFKKELNKNILPYYFQFGYIPAPFSIYKNCYKLEPGHYLEYDLNNNRYHITKYWDIDNCYLQEKIDANEKEILNDLENILEESFNLRMIADVPVGVFLSGGIDSSLVTAILSKKYKLNTFTIGFDDKRYDEASHAKIVANYFKTNHNELYINETMMLKKIEKLPYYYDEPFGDSSSIPTMLVSELAKKQVTVSLSADGGDEIFCGYSKYFALNKINRLFSNKLKKKFIKLSVNLLEENIVEKLNELLPSKIKQRNIKDKFNKFKRAINSNSFEDMFLEATSYSDKNIVRSILNIDINKKAFNKFKFLPQLSLLENLMRIDYKTFLVDDVLVKVDRATMSVSLEGREPLLDHKISEYLGKIPIELKYKNNQGKYLAKQILYKYIPKEIIDKPKSGFQIPLEKWIKEDLKLLVNHYISKEKIDKEIFNIDEILQIKKEVFNGKVKNLSLLWFVLMYQMWKEKWFE